MTAVRGLIAAARTDKDKAALQALKAGMGESPDPAGRIPPAAGHPAGQLAADESRPPGQGPDRHAVHSRRKDHPLPGSQKSAPGRDQSRSGKHPLLTGPGQNPSSRGGLIIKPPMIG